MDTLSAQKPAVVHHSGKIAKPSISKIYYGETGGQKIIRYTLKNSIGMQVSVIN